MTTQAHTAAARAAGLAPDRAEAEKFLTLLDRATTRFTFQIFDDSAKDDSLARVIHGTLAARFDGLARANNAGCGVFICVNATDLKGRKAKNVVRVRALYVDLDGKPLPTEWAKKPHVIIESSPGRYHVYWLVDGCELAEFEGKQRALIARYGGDKGINYLHCVLRLPGFYHRKGEPQLVRIIEVNDHLRYCANDFETAEPRKPSSGEIEFPDGAPDADVDLDEIEWAMRELPNETVEGAVDNDDHPRHFGYYDWRAVCMALHRVFGGSKRGFRIFDAWSAKNPAKHEKKYSNAKTWKSFNKNPVLKITVATIIHYANRAAPGWRERYAADAARRVAENNADDEMMREIAAACAAEGKTLETVMAAASASTSAGTDAGTAAAARADSDGAPDAGAARASAPSGDAMHDVGASENTSAAAAAQASPGAAQASATMEPARIVAALAVVPCDDLDKMGAAIRAATDGSDVGRDLFLAWSRRKHSDAVILEKWSEITRSPPSDIAAGTIIHRANEANPRWPALIEIGNSIEAAIEIVELAALPAAQYDGQRKEAAKRCALRVGTLDDLVERLRPGAAAAAGDELQGQAIVFKPPKPWPEPVDGAALVADMIAAHRRHVVMSEEYALAASLWELHCYALDAAEHTPRLQIRSPAYRCGKSTLLRVIKAIVSKPIEVENISTAALFRLIELCQPTILLDEAEAFLKRETGKDNEELRGIVNAGHQRGGGVVRIVTVNDEHVPRLFNVFAPLCFCWLVRRGEQVAQTIADRSITIELRRRLKGEEITRLRSNRVGHLSVLGRRAARWAADHMKALTDADPEMPDELNDRAQDNWRPLIAIADAMSKDLGEKARAAALAMSAEAAIADEDTSLLALADADAIVREKQAEAARTGEADVEALPSEDLVKEFVAMPDRPWATWRKGSGNGPREPMTKHSLARLLKPYGIRPKLFRGPEGGVFRGYEAKPIRDAKERFVDTEVGFEGAGADGF